MMIGLLPLFVLGSPLEIFKWLVSWPILFLLFLTLPDVNQPRWEKYYLVSFFGSTVWIAVFSYVMVWMVRATSEWWCLVEVVLYNSIGGKCSFFFYYIMRFVMQNA
jgi:hypothetical protein